MKKNWIINNTVSKSEIESFISKVKTDRITAKLLLQRNLKEKDQVFDFFKPDLNKLHDPFLMKDMENAVNRFIEMSAIPENEQRPKAISRYEKKILRSIEWIENKFEEFASDELTMDQISVACALDYTIFRYTKDWSINCPNLNQWLDRITELDIMKSTLPGVSFKYE